MKDRDVRLNDIVTLANRLRAMRNLPGMVVINYMRSKNFVESVIAAEIKLGLREKGDYSGITVNRNRDGHVRNYNFIDSPLVRSVSGRYGGSWVHPWIGIDAAVYMDKELAIDLYEILTTSPIFQLREEGGDLYKELYEAVQHLVGPMGRAPAKAQLLARIIAARAGLPIRPDNTTWNYATAEQLQTRHAIQTQLIAALRNLLIVDFQKLLEYAASGAIVGFSSLNSIDLTEVVKEKVIVLNNLEQQLAA